MELQQSLRDAIDRLRQIAGDDQYETLSRRLDPEYELTPLREAVERLVQAAPRTLSLLPSTVEAARRKWVESGRQVNQLTARDVRALCGDSSVATEPPFVAALASLDLAGKRQWIERLIQSYFAEWGAISDQTRIERLLRDAVFAFAGTSPRILKCVQPRFDIFSSEAHVWLATQALARQASPEQVIDEWRIPADGRLARAVHNAALEEWVRAFRNACDDKAMAEPGVAAYLQLQETLLASPLLDPALVGAALSEVVLWDHAASSDHFRAQLLDFLLSDARFGDPRLPHNSGKWSSFDSRARTRVVSWLARHDLLFFFNLVIDRDPHRRRDFWLNYIDQVEDSNVALCDEDEAKLLRATRLDQRGNYSKIVGKDGVSAFLMRFRGAKGLVFVEFSEPNNALYVHARDTFDSRFGSIRSASFDLDRDLKHRSHVDWFAHHANWQTKVRAFLAGYGIRRKQ